jgi:hypothetical protein
MKAANILETIGDTPHIRINRLFADRPQVEVWMKAERANPGGSIKDRIGLSMLEDAAWCSSAQHDLGRVLATWCRACDGGRLPADSSMPARCRSNVAA